MAGNIFEEIAKFNSPTSGFLAQFLVVTQYQLQLRL